VKRATSARAYGSSRIHLQSAERQNVPRHNDLVDENFDAANARLNDGLKSCRAVLSNYRALLADGESEHGRAGFRETGE
jgi:hypothetical protein